jgi:DNA-binding Lrp family transcriptional regulator
MDISEAERRLLAAIQGGLPLVAQPYAAVGAGVGMTEQQVIGCLGDLQRRGVIKRLGVIVRHHELGYRANAMVVWDVPDTDVAALGHCLGGFDFVTLCYRRPRRLPDWPYNLFCMIHGRDRDAVLQHIAFVVERCGLQTLARAVLFSNRRYKQRGALYLAPATDAAGAHAPVGAA